MFKRKRPAAPVEPEHIQIRSAYGSAYHIRKSSEGLALCGYAGWVATNTTMEVTAEMLIESAQYQHDGWYWCPACAHIITGISEDFFIAKRKESL